MLVLVELEANFSGTGFPAKERCRRRSLARCDFRAATLDGLCVGMVVDVEMAPGPR